MDVAVVVEKPDHGIAKIEEEIISVVGSQTELTNLIFIRTYFHFPHFYLLEFQRKP